MFEVESTGLLSRKQTQVKGSNGKSRKFILIALIGFASLYFGYKLLSNRPTIILAQIPAYQGGPKAIDEIIHTAHYLSLQAPIAEFQNSPSRVLSDFMRQYISIRNERLSDKERDNLMAIQDIVNALEQRDSVPEEMREPSKFWEQVAPALALKQKMVADPSLTTLKTYKGKLAHGTPKDRTEKRKNLKQGLAYSEDMSTAMELLFDVELLSASQGAAEEFLRKVVDILDLAMHIAPSVLEKAAAQAKSQRSALLMTFLAKVGQFTAEIETSESLFFILTFEFSRLSATLTAESQMLCRAVETVVQNMSMYRYLSRTKIAKALQEVFPVQANKERLRRGAILNSPIVDQQDSEGAWIELAKSTWH